MYVFISDIHLGRSDAENERRVERDLISLLRSVQPEVEALFLVGVLGRRRLESGQQAEERYRVVLME